jgi:DNA-binding PucR family transcriptional regulator
VSVGADKRPLAADELLPERALAGDSLARQTLIETYYLPLAKSSPELLATLRAYLDCGRSLEMTAKALFVHANTVRYRLKRIFEEIAADPTDSRTAFVLQVALLLGAINDNEYGLKR